VGDIRTSFLARRCFNLLDVPHDERVTLKMGN
jgi:hypothetical protein